MDSQEESFSGPARLELMGHRLSVGQVQTVVLAGQPVFKVTKPAKGEGAELQVEYYAPSALYCLTPISQAELDAYYARRSRSALMAPEFVDGDYDEDMEEEVDGALFEGGRLSPVDVTAKLNALGLPTSLHDVAEWSSTQRLEVDIWAQLEWKARQAPGLVDRVPAPEVVREHARLYGFDISASDESPASADRAESVPF